MSAGDVMHVVERWWTIVVCGECDARREFGSDSPNCTMCGARDWRQVEVVPAERLRGAVQERDELRALVRDAVPGELGPEAKAWWVERADALIPERGQSE